MTEGHGGIGSSGEQDHAMTAQGCDAGQSEGRGMMCETCRLWKERPATMGEPQKGVGYCRRYPQVVLKLRNDWCGEYNEKTDDE